MCNATHRRHLSFLLRQFFVRSAQSIRRHLSHSHYAERKIHAAPLCRSDANRSAPRRARLEIDPGCEPRVELAFKMHGLGGMLDKAAGDASQYELSSRSSLVHRLIPNATQVNAGVASRSNIKVSRLRSNPLSRIGKAG